MRKAAMAQIAALGLTLSAAQQQLKSLALQVEADESGEPDMECDHPEEDREDLDACGVPEKWHCTLCGYVFEADKIEEEEEE